MAPVSQDQIPPMLRRFDVCIQLASPGGSQHYSPLKVLEYLACGRPVIAPKTATSGLLTDDLDALLYAPGDVESLARCAVRIHDDPPLARRLGSTARELARQHGSWATVAQTMLSETESFDVAARGS